MARVFYIQASPRLERSHSIAVADDFVEAYKKGHPADEIVITNLFHKDLPSFNGLAVQAKYSILHGLEHSEAELSAWRAVERVIEEFMSFDKYVLACPMWNFSIPYPLKHYLDLIVQPTYTFEVTPEGEYKGLATGKPLQLILARGGEYPADTPLADIDFQSRYLQMAFGFIGFTRINTIMIEPTLAQGPETARSMRDKASEEARKLARDF